MGETHKTKSTLSGVVDGIFSTGVGSILMTVLGLVGFMLTSRWLEKDEVGAFVILQLVTNFLVGLSGFGLELSITKYLAETKEPGQQQRIIGNVVAFRLFTILLFSGIALILQQPLFTLFGGTAYTQIVLYLPLMLLLESLYRLIDSVFGGVFDFKWIGLSTGILSVINLVLIVVFVGWQDFGLPGRIWARMIAVGSAILIALVFTRIRLKLRLDFRLLGEMLRFSVPLYINFLLTFLFQRADTFIIGGFMGPEEIAIYEIARKIPESIESLYDAFRKVYFPFISDLFGQKKQQEAAAMLNHSMRLIAVAGVFGVLVAFFFGKEIIFSLFSDSYQESVLLFGLLMIVLLMNVIEYTLGYSLVAVGESSRPAMINVLHTALNFLGYYVLIPLSSIFGIALANLAGVSLVNPVNVFFLRRKQVDVRARNYVIPILLGAFLVSGYYFFDLDAWYFRVLMIFAYFGFCFLFKVLSVKDIWELINQLKRIRKNAKEKNAASETHSSVGTQKTAAFRKMTIVYVANVLPYPPNSGHRIRNYNLLKRLGEKHDLHLFLLVAEPPTASELDGLKPFTRSVHWYVQSDDSAFAQPVKGIQFLLRGIPPDLRFSEQEEMMRDLRAFIQENMVDLMQIEDPTMARYVEAIAPGKDIKTVLTFHDINFKKFARIAKLEPSIKRKLRLRLHSLMLRSWEPKYAERFDMCVTMSEVDTKLLTGVNPRLFIQSVPNGVDTKLFSLIPESQQESFQILFVGNMDYRPNIDAVLFFVKQVMPLLDRAIPSYEFWIVGINPREEVLALKSNRVHVTGRVPDVRPYYQKAQVVVVPLFAGGGTRLKILEALSLGRPVVSTTIGAEGLDLVPGKHLLIADTVFDFTHAIEYLTQEEAFRQNLIDQGRERVAAAYDWDAIASQLEVYYLTLMERNDE